MLDLAVVDAGELVTCAGQGRTAESLLGLIEDGAFAVAGGRVAWVGTTHEFRRKTFGKPRRTVSAKGRLVTPGFVDPHTHLAFAGSREDELERKMSGETYLSILEGGGGMQRTIKETRAASTAKIVEESADRVSHLLANGVTTAEVKTGYGQNVATEVKLLDVIRRLGKTSGVELVPTFLGLHAKPPEFRSAADYADFATREMLPAVAREGNARFSDCFCESGVFSREQCERYLRASRALGLALKIHADEFADSGGASLAAELGCVSADHLGMSEPSGIQALAKKGVTAVLLPGTSYYSSIPYADAKGISKAGCPVALGTDLSPNSWIESPQLVMSLACVEMNMTPAQALLGFTRYAAGAIARKELGTLAVGSSADFAIHSVPSYQFIPYRTGGTYVQSVYKRGRLVNGTRAG